MFRILLNPRKNDGRVGTRVLGNRSVPGRSTSLDNSRTRAFVNGRGGGGGAIDDSIHSNS